MDKKTDPRVNFSVDNRGSVKNDPPVENPEQLSQLLPTQRDVKAYAKAPIEVQSKVVEFANLGPYHSATPEVKDRIMALTNDGSFPDDTNTYPGTYGNRMVEYVRNLIDPEEYEINTSGHTDEHKDAMLLQLNTTLEATQAQMMFDHQLFDATLAEFGRCDSTGNWNPHKPLTIKNLLPKLTSSEREQLIDSLLSPIN